MAQSFALTAALLVLLAHLTGAPAACAGPPSSDPLADQPPSSVDAGPPEQPVSPPPKTGSPPASPSLTETELYQQRIIMQALAQEHLTRDPHPEGKTLERIVVVPFDIFTEGDPWPRFLDVVHFRTRNRIIRQEMLFETGQAWNQGLVDETERNLRNYLTLSVARIVPAQGSSPSQVVAVVVTKDLWSLRLDWDYTYADNKLEALSLNLQETNLGGRNQTVGGLFVQDLATNSVGFNAAEPRLFGTRTGVSVLARAIENRFSGSYEGDTASISVGQPLFSLETEWAWGLSVTQDRDIYRLFSGGNIAEYQDTTTGDLLPYSFGRHVWSSAIGITHSSMLDRPDGYKHNVTLGWKLLSKNYSLPIPTTSLQAQTLVDFQNNIEPRSEQAGILYLGYHFYQPQFVRLQDINTYALAEDFQLGPSFSAEADYANPAFGFGSTFVAGSASAAYTWWTHDDLLTVGAGAQARHETDILAGTSWVNESASASIDNASPRFGPFRFHSIGQLVRRNHDLDHNISTLGGDSLLRGYPSAFFVGSNMWSANFELRTLPLEFHTVYAGLVGFVDLGDAFYSPSQMQVFSSVGAGARILFPQFNRFVLRLDAGIPLVTAPGVSAISVVSSFGQAFN